MEEKELILTSPKLSAYEEWLNREKLIEEEGFNYYAYGQAKVDKKHLAWVVMIEKEGKVIPYNIFTHQEFFKALSVLRENTLKEIDKYLFTLEVDIATKKDLYKREKTSYHQAELKYSQKELRDFKKMLLEEQERYVFEKRVRAYLMYYFSDNENVSGIDVYTQVMMNWQQFINYLCRNANLLKIK